MPHRPARLVLAAALLSGCAAHVIPPPVVQTSPITGRLETGIVVSVRPIDPAADPAVTSAILSALGQTAPPAPQNTVEIVIRRQDHSITSIVQQQGPGQPAFTPGEPVTIVEAATTTVRPE